MPLNPVTEAFRRELSGALGPGALRDYTPAYSEEPRGRFHGGEACLVAPANRDEVATILRRCNAARVGVVPFGGGTGLVGGQVLPGGPAPVVLTLERMDAISDLRADENVLVAGAGAVLQSVQEAAERADRLFPLSLASEGTARIGGVLATNAGGACVLRYGNARALCLGLEVVLADGSLWRGLSRLGKDNLGYDLRDLMIGSEGTLGVITAASLRLHPRPARMAAAFLEVPGPGAALALLNMAREHLGGTVSAFELIHRQGLEFLREVMPGLRQPFKEPPEWSVLADIGAPAAMDIGAALEGLLEDATQRGLILDGVVAQSEAQRRAFWDVREAIPAANRRIGPVASHDISVPLGLIPEFIARAGAEVARIGAFRVNCFGHVGDGNLHYNVFPASGARGRVHVADRARVREAVHELVHALGGSVAAEHGVGRLKVGDLERYADPARLTAMRAIKAALDPVGIMNPGAVLSAPA